MSLVYRISHPFTLTIFGASGDLAKLKLFPALYSLAEQKRLPSHYAIIGFSRTFKEREQFQQEFAQSIRVKCGRDVDEKILQDLVKHTYYWTGQYDDPESFVRYRRFVESLFPENQKNPHLAYFSVPPQAFQPIIKNLGETRKNPQEDLRLIIEKPFGEDVKTATKLYHFLARYFQEEQIYLLDHYLGKSGVQSILHLRQTNRILHLLLQGREIANIQITAFEDIGITNRVGYFEQVGLIKDMIQSHLLQVLALTTMSIPLQETAASVQREKFSILSALYLPEGPGNVLTGQYQSYYQEPGVAKDSQIETFAACRLFIDQEQWYNVPIYIRTGKKLSQKKTVVTVEFKKFPFQPEDQQPNLLTIEISPEEKVTIQLMNKYRSGSSSYETVSTSKSIACSGDFCLPEHGLLLLDVIRGNKISFLSFDEILASWGVTEALLERLKSENIKPEVYQDGNFGPLSQHSLPTKDGFAWHGE